MKKHTDNQGQAPDRLLAISEHYEPRISPSRPGYQVLDWASESSQTARFQVLADKVKLGGKSLLDVGCGLGDLWSYLKRRGLLVRYTGVDILEKMVTEAARRHRDGRFVTADIFADPCQAGRQSPFSNGQFDVVFCSGALNLNLGNNLSFVRRAVARFLDLSAGEVVFNLLHHRARGDDDRYFYYDPLHVVQMLKDFPCRSTIIDDYLPNDFTIICQKG